MKENQFSWPCSLCMSNMFKQRHLLKLKHIWSHFKNQCVKMCRILSMCWKLILNVLLMKVICKGVHLGPVFECIMAAWATCPIHDLAIYPLMIFPLMTFPAPPGTDSRSFLSSAPAIVHKECQKETTPWSACTATCDMGFSVRVTNDNEDCLTMEQRRLCMVRPCELKDRHLVRTRGEKVNTMADDTLGPLWYEYRLIR